jgi:hypothetical protein
VLFKFKYYTAVKGSSALNFEIQVIMPAAPGVKSCITAGALVVAAYIFADGHFMTANTAQYGFFIPFFFCPYCSGMAGFFFMALKAGIILSAAFEFNGNHIGRGVIMHTACLFICQLAL